MVSLLRLVTLALMLSCAAGFTAALGASSSPDDTSAGVAQVAVEPAAEEGASEPRTNVSAAQQTEDPQEAFNRLRNLAIEGQAMAALQGMGELLRQDLPAELRVRIYATAISIAANEADWTRAFAWVSEGMTYLPKAPESGAILLAAASYLHTMVDDTERAVVFGRRALEMAEAGSDSGVQCRVLSMLALAFDHNGDLAEAEQLRRRQIEVCASVDDQVFVTNGMHGLSQALLKKGRPAEALPWAERALAVAQASNFPLGANNAKLAIAASLVALKQEPQRAAAMLGEARRDYLRDETVVSLAEMEELWATLDENGGNPFGALAHLRKAMAYSKEVEANARARQLAYLHVRFGTELQAQKIDLLEAEKSLAELAITANHRRQWLLAVGLGGLLITAVLLSILLRRTFRDRQRYLWTSEHDGLTGIYNHEKVCKLGEVGFASARRAGRPFTAIALDIDSFKSVNDRYGHAAGDAALRSMGAWISMAVGAEGIGGRRGGDEFTILLDADAAAATALLERLRALIEPINVLGQTFHFSISAGVCQASPDVATLEQLLHLADQALYRAKHEGGNRVVRADEEEGSTSPPMAELVVVGSGIHFGRHASERTLSEIRRADVVLCLVDPFALAMIQSFCAEVINLGVYYAPGKDRRVTYREIDAAIMAQVRAGKRVCAVFYGHPGVFADVPHKVIRQAREEGFAARMEPGVSAEACLYADLGIDPGRRGVQSIEATQLLMCDRQLDPAGLVLVWQVALAGDLTCSRFHAEQAGLQALVDKLLRWYPPEHEAILYEAAQLPIDTPRADRLRLCDVPTAHYREFTTLVIPPLGELQPDPDPVLRAALT